MKPSRLRATAATVAALASLAVAAVGHQTAGAMPPRCGTDPTTCPDPQEPPGGPEETAPPETQPPPPAPFGTPSQFTYSNFTVFADAAIGARLGAPASGQPWPLATIPYVREVANAPVTVTQVDDNLWAFSSIDAGGRASACQGTCSDTPQVVINPNYGLHQATLHMRPRLDVELWGVVVTFPPNAAPVVVPDRVTEVTATLHMRAFAECDGWENGTATLNAKMGVGNVTIRRDTSFEEDLKNFFLPNFTAGKSAQIRNRLMSAIGVGQFSDIPGAAGTRCYTLGVRGDAHEGAITWNELPCLFPENGCSAGGGGVGRQ
jgi:hypothetical protein